MSSHPEFIYHMAHQNDWQNAKTRNIYEGSPDDLRDGFIHFSTVDQIRGSAAKHRAGQENLLLICYRTDGFDSCLKWEGGSDLFPHIYGILKPLEAVSVVPLPLGSSGAHVFPEGFPS